jgi:hypothetical protein
MPTAISSTFFFDATRHDQQPKNYQKIKIRVGTSSSRLSAITWTVLPVDRKNIGDIYTDIEYTINIH